MKPQSLTGARGTGSESPSQDGKWTRVVEQVSHFVYQAEFSEFLDMPEWTLLLRVFRKV